METTTLRLSQISTNNANPRLIKEHKFEKLVDSILVFPKMLALRPIVVNEQYVALGGNMRYRALSYISEMTPEEVAFRLSGLADFKKKTEAEQIELKNYWSAWLANPHAIVMNASDLSEQEKREFIIKDNVGFGEWDMDMLSNEWDEKELEDWGLDVWQTEDEGEGADIEKRESSAGVLRERFIVPPFSILDSRRGEWQKRKKAWRAIIGDNGESRNDTLIKSIELKYKDLYQKTRAHRQKFGISFKEYLEKYVSEEEKRKAEKKVTATGVSILDPVMAEIVCKWFGVDGGNVFDCFAGDSVFGYVAAHEGFNFTGIELRPEQARLNNERVEGMTAKYINDDGQNVAKYIEPESQDLLFSCPPYFDLEVYSDDPKDASNQDSYEDFIHILKNAFTESLKCLKENRFAVVVIGDVRNKKTGFYYNLVDDLKRIFKEAGAPLYNEIILLEQTANSALRSAKAMESRKVVKVHQNILVFYKGDTKHIKDNFKVIEYDEQDLESFRMDFGDESEETETEF